MKLHVLEHGHIEARDAPFLTEDGVPESVTATWPVRCHLLQHPDGWLLWDTGLPEHALQGDPGALGGNLKFVTNSLEAWLSGFGLTPDAPDLLVGFSHMHVDHAGNANLFARSRILVNERELVHALGDHPGGPYYRPGYGELDGSRATFTGDGHDVFGDGLAVIRAAPGHSPGHQALMVSLPGDQPVLLMGDSCYAAADLAHRRAPVWNYNQRETYRSLDKLIRIAGEAGARLAFHHDPDTPV